MLLVPGTTPPIIAESTTFGKASGRHDRHQYSEAGATCNWILAGTTHIAEHGRHEQRMTIGKARSLDTLEGRHDLVSSGESATNKRPLPEEGANRFDREAGAIDIA